MLAYQDIIVKTGLLFLLIYLFFYTLERKDDIRDSDAVLYINFVNPDEGKCIYNLLNSKEFVENTEYRCFLIFDIFINYLYEDFNLQKTSLNIPTILWKYIKCVNKNTISEVKAFSKYSIENLKLHNENNEDFTNGLLDEDISELYKQYSEEYNIIIDLSKDHQSKKLMITCLSIVTILHHLKYKHILLKSKYFEFLFNKTLESINKSFFTVNENKIKSSIKENRIIKSTTNNGNKHFKDDILDLINENVANQGNIDPEILIYIEIEDFITTLILKSIFLLDADFIQITENLFTYFNYNNLKEDANLISESLRKHKKDIKLCFKPLTIDQILQNLLSYKKNKRKSKANDFKFANYCKVSQNLLKYLELYFTIFHSMSDPRYKSKHIPVEDISRLKELKETSINNIDLTNNSVNPLKIIDNAFYQNFTKNAKNENKGNIENKKHKYKTVEKTDRIAKISESKVATKLKQKIFIFRI